MDDDSKTVSMTDSRNEECMWTVTVPEEYSVFIDVLEVRDAQDFLRTKIINIFK